MPQTCYGRVKYLTIYDAARSTDEPTLKFVHKCNVCDYWHNQSVVKEQSNDQENSDSGAN